MDSNEVPRRKSIAVVIGSGAAKCAASLGLYALFQREGLGIDLAVGSSGGSIYAAAIALGYDVQTAAKYTAEFWTSELMEGYASNLRAALSGETRFTEHSGLIDDHRVMEHLEKVFGDKTFADTHVPLFIVSTDLYSGERITLSSGRVLDAIRASIAIPMIFSPWQIGDHLLVDGAVSDPLPVDVAIREGGDIIVAMGFELPVRSRMHSYTSTTAHFNSIYMNNILKSTFSFYNLAHHAEVIPILPEFERHIGTFDGDQTAYIIEQGLRATEQQLLYLNRLVGKHV